MIPDTLAIAQDPNSSLLDLESVAPLHPEEVLANPVLPLFALERPDLISGILLLVAIAQYRKTWNTPERCRREFDGEHNFAYAIRVDNHFQLVALERLRQGNHHWHWRPTKDIPVVWQTSDLCTLWYDEKEEGWYASGWYVTTLLRKEVVYLNTNLLTDKDNVGDGGYGHPDCGQRFKPLTEID